MADATPYSDQKNWSNTYLTDPALVKLLGPFDLDPCCPPKMPWRTARLMLTDGSVRKTAKGFYYPAVLNGLDYPWRPRDRVFMNPPYRGVLQWARKFVEQNSGIALLNGRATETAATQLIMEKSAAIWFPDHRLTFYKPSGKPFEQKWFPSLLLGLHPEDAARMRRAQAKFGGNIFIKSRL
jgi:hypothetical protein